MAVFDECGIKAVLNRLDDKFADMLRLHCEELDGEVFSRSFLTEHERSVLTEAQKLVATTSTQTFFIQIRTGDGLLQVAAQGCNLSFVVPKFFLPLKISLGEPLTDYALPLHTQANNLYRLIQEIVSMRACVVYLNNICVDAAQLNAYIPALAKFMRGREDEEAKGLSKYNYTFQNNSFFNHDLTTFQRFSAARKRLISGKAPATIPPVRREIVQLCRGANTLLLRCALMTEDMPKTPGVQSGKVGIAVERKACHVQLPEVFGSATTNLIGTPKPVIRIVE